MRTMKPSYESLLVLARMSAYTCRQTEVTHTDRQTDRQAYINTPFIHTNRTDRQTNNIQTYIKTDRHTYTQNRRADLFVRTCTWKITWLAFQQDRNIEWYKRLKTFQNVQTWGNTTDKSINPFQISTIYIYIYIAIRYMHSYTLYAGKVDCIIPYCIKHSCRAEPSTCPSFRIVTHMHVPSSLAVMIRGSALSCDWSKGVVSWLVERGCFMIGWKGLFHERRFRRTFTFAGLGHGSPSRVKSSPFEDNDTSSSSSFTDPASRLYVVCTGQRMKQPCKTNIRTGQDRARRGLPTASLVARRGMRQERIRHDQDQEQDQEQDQDKTRQDKTRQDKTRQDKTRQDNTRQDKTTTRQP
jgi:hypothetical protein